MWPHTPSPEPALSAPCDLHRLLAGRLSQYAVILLDPQGRVTDWNPGAEVLLGYPAAEALGTPFGRLFTPEDQARGAAEHDLRRASAEGRVSHTRWLVRRDESRVWVACETVALRDEGGRLLGFGKVVRDLSAKRNVEEIRSRLASILESFDTAIVSVDAEWMVDGWNEWAERLFGYRADEIVGRSVLTLVPPDQHAEARRVMGLVWGGERVPPYEAVRLHKAGRLVHVSVNPWPVRDASGSMVALAAVYTDISDRLRARAALQQREELLRNVITHIPCGVFWKDRDSVYLGCNDQFVRDYGLADASQVVGRTDADLCADPDEAAFYHECDRRVVGSGQPLLNVEETLTLAGRRATLLTSKVPLRDAAGAVVGVLGVYQDITGRKKLEEQYRQAQKMEAVGRLAGGVAHDFNNILTVIIGYGDIALSGLPPGHPSREWVAGVVAAGERAAVLTRQLLAFSRKEVVAPRVIDLNAVIADVERMLRRLIGADVTLAVRLQPDLGHIRADPGQMEQVVLNLAVNARDAMPRGGRLTIATADAELDAGGEGDRPAVGPGRYVRLAVSDTGVGMTDEVKRRLFEPFFTTKGVGKGTGLGLATVEGIVKQGGGVVEVASEPGRGSTFAVYLPRVELPVSAAPEPAAPGAPPRGTETVLVAEDDPGVRALTCQVLRDAGYEVIEAGDGEEAVRAAAARTEPLHLLVTDVVMPGMSGREVAEAVAARHPQVRVLYLSGYTDDAVVRHGIQEKQVAFLQKPFTPTSFAQRVRGVLDRGT